MISEKTSVSIGIFGSFVVVLVVVVVWISTVYAKVSVVEIKQVTLEGHVFDMNSKLSNIEGQLKVLIIQTKGE